MSRAKAAITRSLDIVAAMAHPGLFGPYFRGASWDGWRTFLKGAYALPMSDAERVFFRTIAEREPPKRRVRERWCIAGRGAGKDSITSLDIAFSAALFDQQDRLRPGERASVLCLACDREQAKIVLNYVGAYFTEIPPLKAMVVRETSDGFELNNGVDIVVATNSFRSTRGRTILSACLDEVAFWQDETSTRPDVETYNALRPGLRLPTSTMTVISTPYRRSGLLYNKFAKHFGRDDDDVLVIKAPSIVLNPTLDQAIIDQAIEADAAVANAEWLAEFRDDLAAYVPRDLIEAAVDRGVVARPYDPRHRYVSFCDASSGQQDSFAAAVTHMEGDIAILDCLVEVPAPFSTAAATATVAGVLKSYRLSSTMGDDFARGWVISEFGRHGIRFEPRPTEMNRSALYLEALPLFTAARVRLLDSARLISQFCALERRVMAGGRDRVDHPNRSGHHDDLANSCAGALWRCSQELLPADWSLVLPLVAALGRHGGGASGFQIGERAAAQAAQRRQRRFS